MTRNRAFCLILSVLLGAAGLGLAGSPANASSHWADADTATIHPGVQMYTDGAQCTSNFVFEDPSTADVFIGYAAHCAGPGAATETDGCLAGSHPLGTPVEIEGATEPGELVYSSWLAMQEPGAPAVDANACAYNDFALVRVDPADVSRVNPSIPHWGGPTGINTEGNPLGSAVYSYGNSSLRLGLTVLSPKEGTSLGTSGGGWTHPVYTATPGIPGDSGSAMLDAQGRASGVLSTVALAPLTGSNNFSDLALALDYMRSADPELAGVSMVEGTEAFNGSALPLGV